MDVFSGELIFGGAYYGKKFCVSKWVGLDNKNNLKHYENSLKQLKTASTNSPWAYIREGLLLEGFLRLRFGGLVFGRAYFWGYYYRNFTVFWQHQQLQKLSKALVSQLVNTEGFARIHWPVQFRNFRLNDRT